MDAEFARQFGQGLDRLSASFLAHQGDSARDRQTMLTKFDALDHKFDAKFDALASRIVDVCDRGGEQHRTFAARLDAIERRLATDEALQLGRSQAVKFMADAGSWTFKHGWKVAAILYIGMQFASEIAASFTPPQAQAVEIRGAL